MLTFIFVLVGIFGNIKTFASVEYPGNVSGDLVLWLDGADTSTLFTNSNCSNQVSNDGDGIGCWKDKSGKGNDVKQSVNNNRPIYRENMLNGNPALDFDDSGDSDDHLATENAGQITANGSYTKFVVFKYDDENEVNNLISSDGGNSSPGKDLGTVLWLAKTKKLYVWDQSTYGNYPGKLHSEDLTKDSYHIAMVRYNKNPVNSVYSSMDINGTLVATGDWEMPRSSHKITIGAHGIRNGLDGKIAEALVYNRGLTDAEINNVECYLSEKWGIPTTNTCVALDKTNFPQYKIFQRNSTDKYSFHLSGTYTGNCTGIEASFNGSTFSTIANNLVGGIWSGTLSDQNVGQGEIVVRCVNKIIASDFISKIGIGDVYVVAGQSNAVGYAFNKQKYNTIATGTSVFPTVYTNGDIWKEANDKTDIEKGTGSAWPILGGYIVKNTGIPVMFITTAAGTKGLVNPKHWDKGYTGNCKKGVPCYTNMINQINEANTDGIKAVLWFQGETDADNNVSQSDYNTALDALASNIVTDLPGNPDLVAGVIGAWSQNTGGVSPIRSAIIEAREDNNKIKNGPETYDLNVNHDGGDHYHFQTDKAIQTLGYRWWKSLEQHYYSSGVNQIGRGPKLKSSYFVGDNDYIYFDFITNSALKNGTDHSLWEVKDASGVILSIANISLVDSDTIKLTLTNKAEHFPLKVTYAKDNVGENKAILTDSTTGSIGLGTSELPADPFEVEIDSNMHGPYKSIVFDFADIRGDGWSKYMGVRGIDFYKDGKKIKLLPDTDYMASATTLLNEENGISNSNYLPNDVFNTSLPLIGLQLVSGKTNSWISKRFVIDNQRLIFTTNKNFSFDIIKFNNLHLNGSAYNVFGGGVKNTKIYLSEQEITDTTYQSGTGDMKLIFSGILPKHPPTNTPQNYTIPLLVTGTIIMKHDPLNDFVTTWRTTGANETITIPTYGGGYYYNLDCDNDGVFEQTAVTGNGTCNFSTSGNHKIRISGAFPWFAGYRLPQSERDKLIEINQWGNIQWKSMKQSFYGAKNVELVATDIPDLSKTIDMQSMFWGAHSIGSSGSVGNWNWDTSNIINMQRLFYDAKSFNKNINSWDTSKVANMMSLFNGAIKFNQPLTNWKTSRVTRMNGMFSRTTLFNQDLSHFDTSNVTDMNHMFYNAKSFNQNIGNWNTRNVTDMTYLFLNAKKFNQDISKWNTSNVTSMYQMFARASEFNQDISNWDYDQVKQFSSFLYIVPKYSDYNYDAFLKKLERTYLTGALMMYNAGTRYCEAGAERQSLRDNGRNITDAGQQCSATKKSLTPPQLVTNSDSGKENNDGITNERKPIFTGSCLTGDATTKNVISLYNGSGGTVGGTEMPLGTGLCNNNGIFSIALTNDLPLGPQTISYTQKKSGGAGSYTYVRPESEKSPGLDINIDNKNPHSLNIEIDTETHHNIHQPVITFSAQDNESGIWKYELEIDGTSTTSGVITVFTGSGVKKFTPQGMDTSKTTHKVKITAYDIAGNSETRELEYPPVVNIQTGSTLSSGAITVSVHIYGPNAIALSGIVASGVDTSGIPISENLNCHYTSASSSGDVACSVSVKGTGRLKITAKDDSGAEGRACQNYVIDTQAPTIKFSDDISSGPVRREDVILNVTDTLTGGGATTGTYLQPTSYQWVLINNAANCDSNVDFSAGTLFTVGATIAFETEANNGKYICAKAEDKVGNITYQKSANALNIDRTAPIVAFATDPLHSINRNTMNDDYIFTGSCSSGDNVVKVEVNGLSGGVNQSLSQTGTCTAGGTFSITFANSLHPNFASYDDGDLSVTLSQMDGAGNTGTILSSITKITTAPIATISYSPHGRTNQEVIVILSGSTNLKDNLTGRTIGSSLSQLTTTLTENKTETIIFSDIAGNTGSVSYTITGIDTNSPNLALNGANPIELIQGTNYTDAGAICSDSENSCSIVSGGNVNINLTGTYYRNYTGTDLAGNIVSLQRTIHVVEKVDGGSSGDTGSSSSHGGGGGSGAARRDRCPGGDNSPSYYDGSCGEKTDSSDKPQNEEEVEREEKVEKVEKDSSDEPQNDDEERKELESAYEYAKRLGITTMPTFEKFNYTGLLLRKDMAKMMSVFKMKELKKDKVVMGNKCSQFQDISNLSQEYKTYIELSCRLGIMGLNGSQDGVLDEFNPEGIVSRAEFGTVLSRAMRGKKYAAKKGETRYGNHLKALKSDKIMKYIDQPWNKELRGWVIVMLFRIHSK